MYPIKGYINNESTGDKVEDGIRLQRLNDIIACRYRKRSYLVYWLVFCREGAITEPDMSLVDPRMNIRERDKFVVAPVTREQIRLSIYPCCKRILSHFVGVTEFVLGGFHQTDCVDKMARAACDEGMRVRVDEDTTDCFFMNANCGYLSPIYRTPQEYALDFVGQLRNSKDSFVRSLSPVSIRDHQEERRRKPWLVQLPSEV